MELMSGTRFAHARPVANLSCQNFSSAHIWKVRASQMLGEDFWVAVQRQSEAKTKFKRARNTLPEGLMGCSPLTSEAPDGSVSVWRKALDLRALPRAGEEKICVLTITQTGRSSSMWLRRLRKTTQLQSFWLSCWTREPTSARASIAPSTNHQTFDQFSILVHAFLSPDVDPRRMYGDSLLTCCNQGLGSRSGILLNNYSS